MPTIDSRKQYRLPLMTQDDVVSRDLYVAKTISFWANEDSIFDLKKFLVRTESACFFWTNPNGPFLHIS